MSNSKRTVDFGSIEKLSKILGTFDENLNFLAHELGVIPYVDGVKICLQGETDQVDLAHQVLSALLVLAENGESVDKGRMAYCIELAREGRSGEIACLCGGVIAVTSKGKQIKCKTVGQKTYVEAIKKSTVTFGVGPAGTGKTYLAVCMAVTAYKSKQVDKIILTRPA
ncbi:MAG: PhoH family protein, partial [Clostridia bacterium]|nr:PhoH family protein [Clostridia bacterium]